MHLLAAWFALELLTFALSAWLHTWLPMAPQLLWLGLSVPVTLCIAWLLYQKGMTQQARLLCIILAGFAIGQFIALPPL